MNPETRRLIRVTAEEVEKTANMFDLSNEMRIGYKEALKHYITLFGSVNKA